MNKGTQAKSFGTSGIWKGWVELPSDVNWQDHGGKWGIKDPSNASQFYILRFENMDSLCGSDNEGHDAYLATTFSVDLDNVSEDDIASALSYVGFDADEMEWSAGHPVTPEEFAWIKAEALESYGAAERMSEFSDPSYPDRARAAARRDIQGWL